MKLVYLKTGVPVNYGDVAHTFRGEPVIVEGWQAPRHEGSTGRVYVKEMTEHGFSAAYYPSVIDAVWVE